MRAAMANAEVGDDVWGDDPTVKHLEAKVADLLGKEAALFVTSGTQGNLCAVMAHCGRGDSFLVGLRAHAYHYEAGGAAVLGSVQPHPLTLLDNGQFDLEQLADSVTPDDPHFAPIRLIAIENTHDGKALPLTYHKQVIDFAAEHELGLHLDGARLWNASTELGVTPRDAADGFDTVTVCLSKGLGAPLGSVLAGSRELIDRAYRVRKILGGAMRQTGIVAAAGLWAIDHQLPRLGDDHRRAERLADGLAKLPGVEVTGRHTNMVFVDLGPSADVMAEAAAANNILLAIWGRESRMVTHCDISDADIETALGVLGDAASQP